MKKKVLFLFEKIELVSWGAPVGPPVELILSIVSIHVTLKIMYSAEMPSNRDISGIAQTFIKT